MTEVLGNNSEIPRSPESPYGFESSAIDSFEAGLLGGIAYAFCSSRCPAREKIEKMGLACPFVITERSQNEDRTWDESDPGLQILGQVAENTWMHCVDDIKAGNEPIILLDLKAQ